MSTGAVRSLVTVLFLFIVLQSTAEVHVVIIDQLLATTSPTWRKLFGAVLTGDRFLSLN